MLLIIKGFKKNKNESKSVKSTINLDFKHLSIYPGQVTSISGRADQQMCAFTVLRKNRRAKQEFVNEQTGDNQPYCHLNRLAITVLKDNMGQSVQKI